MLIATPASQKDYSQLIELWQASVTATHTFLRPADRERIEAALPTYFAQVDLQKWTDKDQLIGFSGRQGAELVMLFLTPTVVGHGYGHRIVAQLHQQAPLLRVDVNEQNDAAYRFYQRQGFRLVDRDPVDGEGRPYPILHLARN